MSWYIYKLQYIYPIVLTNTFIKLLDWFFIILFYLHYWVSYTTSFYLCYSYSD